MLPHTPNRAMQTASDHTVPDYHAMIVDVNMFCGWHTTLELAPSSLARDLMVTTLDRYLTRQPLQEELASWCLVPGTSSEEKKVMPGHPPGDIAPSDVSMVKLTDPLWKYADGNLCRFTMIKTGDPEWWWETQHAGGKLENVNGDTPMSEVVRQRNIFSGDDDSPGWQVCASRDDQRPIIPRGELANTKLRIFVELGWCIHTQRNVDGKDYFTFTVQSSYQTRADEDDSEESK